MDAAVVLSLAGRRRARREGAEGHWGPKWRRVLGDALASCGAARSEKEPPEDYTEFDRTVRGMLNRISTENARRLLPLEPGLRGASDFPAWCSTRFAALMLSCYLQVIHTNRCARGLAMRSADNVLPEYMDAVGPLLALSPRLVQAFLAWLARLLQYHELCWPTARLLLLASREERERAALPGHSLGRLPPELVRGRILSYLAPPALPSGAAAGAVGLISSWGMEDGQKDVVAVLAHFIMFAPLSTWPRLSAFALSLAEAALTGPQGIEDLEEGRLYLTASILVTVAQRLERRQPDAGPAHEAAAAKDLGPLVRLATRLHGASARPSRRSGFVDSRVKAAVEHVRRVQELSCCRAAAAAEERPSGRGHHRR